MDGLARIERYIGALERQGISVVIYDESNLLGLTPLRRLSALGRWHTNAFCMQVKQQKALHRRCMALKSRFVKKVFESDAVVKSTCFCGVSEYAAPLRLFSRPIAIVAAMGYRGALRESVADALSRRTGLERYEFQSLRQLALPQADEESVPCLVEVLVHLLAEYLREETALPTLLDGARGDNEHVLRAMDFIGKHYAEPITAADVARHCHISIPHLQHLFSQVVGHGVAGEIRNCRLALAKELLSTTAYSVTYIALTAGFRSPDYFATVFGRCCGMTPLRYRATHCAPRGQST